MNNIKDSIRAATKSNVKNNKTIKISLFFLAIMLIMSGHGIIIPFLTVMVNKNEPIVAGIVTSAFSVGGLLSAPIIGNFVNNKKSKDILQLTLFAYFIVMLLTFLVINNSNPFPLIILRFLTGVLMSTGFAAVETYISKNEEEENQSSYFLFISFANFIGMVLGPTLGFFMIAQHSNYPILFVLFGIAILTIGLIHIFVKEDSTDTTSLLSPSSDNPFVTLYTEFKIVYQLKTILFSLIAFATFGFVITSFEAFSIPFILKHYTKIFLQTPLWMLLLELLAIGIVSLIYLFIFNPRVISKFGAFNVIITTAFISSISFGLFIIYPSIYVMLLLIFVGVISMAVFSNAIIYYLSTNYDNKGFILGLKNSSMSIGSAVGPIMSGILYAFNPNFFIISISLLLFTIGITGIFLRKAKEI